MTTIEQVVLQPALSLEEAEQQFQGRYLSHADYDAVVEQDTMGTLPGEGTKFVFLRSAVSASDDSLQRAYRALSTLPMNNVRSSLRRRGALRGSQGREMVLGWLDDTRTGPRPAANTWTCPSVYYWLLCPLLAQMGTLLRLHLPGVWEQQAETARHNGERLIGAELQTLIEAKGVRVVEADGSQRPITKSDIPRPLFSTVTVNKNVIFRSHADAKNESGLACITTFGNFAGGHLCLPRFRLAFAVRPGDVLIVDTNREQHGSIGPLAGTRFSVVAYLRNMELRK